jgi:glycosyltransferase involved in cell wall biosynthesis
MLLRLVDNLPSDEFSHRLLTIHDSKISSEFRKRGHEVNVVPFSGALDTTDESVMGYSNVGLALFSKELLRYNVKVRNLIRDADVVWCQNIRALLTIAPVLKLYRTPSIWNIGLGQPSEGWMRPINESALRVADHVFIESEQQMDVLFTERQRQKFEQKFNIFHKGIDVDEFDPNSVEAQDTINGKSISSPAVGTAVNIVPRKGLDDLIIATELLARDHPDVTVYIAGEPRKQTGPYMDQLRATIAERGLSDNVAFLGWVDDMPAFLSTLDVLVLPSLNEGTPGTVREALAMELPVVATDVGGTSEAVIPGETGLLVPPRRPWELASSVSHLLENPPEAERMATNGRNIIVDRFSIKNYVINYENLLSQSIYE